MLLGLFEEYIMKTHQSRRVQFLFFYSFSRNPEFPDIFLSTLVGFFIHILLLLHFGKLLDP